jgi:polysaccharide export outer membrane protein
MTLKPFAIALALVAGAGVAIAHAQQALPSNAGGANGAAAKMPTSAPPAITDYVIGPEDVLQVTVWKNESLTRQLAVRPDGKISMPLLHDVQAAGLTPMQLQEKLATAFGEFMPNPEVAVSVVDVRSYRISVLGEVQKPGVLQLKSDTSVLEAIALAGGFRDFASPSKIMILRKNGDGQTQKIPFNYNRVVKDNRGDGNVMLKAGDVVVVP